MLFTQALTGEQIGWYETGLPLTERKKRGHFSTPPYLVEQILDACGYKSQADLAHIRVLDPACGSGNFLVGATQRLAASCKHKQLSQEEQAQLVQRNIWGFDPDPVSCFLAEMQLYSMMNNIGAQFIAPSNDIDNAGGRNELRPYMTYMHPQIHQADSLTLPWERCVDLFLANPPYLAAKNNDLSGYRSAQQRGQADSYLLFLALALQVVRPGGWIGLVLPDPVLARLNAARERAQLLKQVTLHHLWHLSGVFAAEVGAVVLIAQHTPPTSTHQVSWIRARWQTSPLTHGQHVAQKLFLRQPASELRYLLSNDIVLDRLRATLDDAPEGERRFAPLSEFLSIARGEELGRDSHFITQMSIGTSEICRDAIYRVHHHDLMTDKDAINRIPPHDLPPDKDAINRTPHHDLMTDKDGINRIPPHDLTINEDAIYRVPTNFYPVLRGGVDIRPYSMPTGSWWIDREAVTKPLQRYLSPKLLVVKSTDRLQATLDTRGHVVLQTLYLLHVRDNCEVRRDAIYRVHQQEEVDLLYFFLALLNSRLLREYVYVLHTAYKWVQPQIEQRVLANLPIPIVEKKLRQPIIEQAKVLMHACSSPGAVVEWNADFITMYEELERSIRSLYTSALTE